MDLADCQIEQNNEKLREEIDLLKLQVNKWKSLYELESDRCKIVSNQLHELVGNIRVFARIKPLELVSEELSVIEAVDNYTIAIPALNTTRSFVFDCVLSPESTQAEVFSHVRFLSDSIVDGYNCCLFAYGQTGSGKTYTMEGTANDPGVNVSIMKRIFELINERKNSIIYETKVSIYEVYNEQIVNLLNVEDEKTDSEVLNKKSVNGKTKKLAIDTSDTMSVPVDSFESVWSVIETGKKSRTTKDTHMNSNSSRSHCIVQFQLSSRKIGDGSTVTSKMFLVDLAGSERIDQSRVQGKAMEESININKSLSTLSRVFDALQKKRAHVPYRDSTLTFLLKDVFTGNSKICLIVNLCPSASNLSQSANSLDFASKISKIQLGLIKRNAADVPKTSNYAQFDAIIAKNKEQQLKIQQMQTQIDQNVKTIENLRKKIASIQAEDQVTDDKITDEAAAEKKIQNSVIEKCKKFVNHRTSLARRPSKKHFTATTQEPCNKENTQIENLTIKDNLKDCDDKSDHTKIIKIQSPSLTPTESESQNTEHKKSVKFALSYSILRYNQQFPIKSFRNLLKPSNSLRASNLASEKQKGAQRVILKREELMLPSIKSTPMRTPLSNRTKSLENCSTLTPLKF